MSNLETGPKKTRHSLGSEWKDGSVPGSGLASGCSCSSGRSSEPEGNVDPDPASKASLGGEEGGAPVGAALEGSRRTGRSSKRELLQGPFSRSGACTPAPAGHKCCFRGPSPVAESNHLSGSLAWEQAPQETAAPASHRRRVGWAVPVTSGHVHRPPKPAFSPFPVNPLLHCFLLLALALSGDSRGWGGSDRHRQDRLLILATSGWSAVGTEKPSLHGAVVTHPPFPLLALFLLLTFWLQGSPCSTNSPGLLSSLHRECFEGRAPLPLLQPWL